MTSRDVTRDKLPNVRSLDETGFAEWLKIGFFEFALDDEDFFPFGEAWEFIGRFEDITDDIAAIYNVLWPTEKKRFREGLTRALAELDLGQEDGFVTAQRLVRVAEKISATEMLPVLPTKIFTAKWLTESDAGLELLETAADAAIDLACKTTDAYHALYALVISPAFRSSSARKALLALCKALPENLDFHLQLLAKHLYWMFIEREKVTGRNLADARARLFLEVAELVDANILIKTIDLYNPEVVLPDLEFDLSWWGEVLLARNTSDQIARSLDELVRKILLNVRSRKRVDPVAPVGFAAYEWDEAFSTEIKVLAETGTFEGIHRQGTLHFDVSSDDLLEEIQCAMFVDHPAGP